MKIRTRQEIIINLNSFSEIGEGIELKVLCLSDEGKTQNKNE